MKRLVLFLEIVLLLGVMAAVVVFRSPYSPVVDSVKEIEEIWAIEDSRSMSEKPLVDALRNQDVPLVYNEDENTFYCTLGLDNGGDWPELYLTAPDAKRGLQLCFVDDYSYDWCDEAIRKGYSYEVMAYTEHEYSYFYVVFTGLPLLSIVSDADITDVDTPANVTLAVYGEQGVSTYARIHLRGGLSRGSEKPAYKVEFTRRADGTDKISLPTPEIGYTDELILLPMPFDRLLMRDRLSWEVYARLAPDESCFAAKPTAYTEVVINGEYAGVYVMMEPFDVEDELQKVGTSHLLTDSVYRTCVSYMSEGRALLEHPIREGAGYELFYSSEKARPFSALQDYVHLLTEEEDTVFAGKALEQIDLQDMLLMEILLQAGGMTDNVFNNLYIWAEKSEKGYVYHYIPWDMDLTWGLKKEDVGEQFENWMYFPVADRLINLNPDRRVRGELLRMWQKARENVLNLETLEQITDLYEHELNDSGAMLRNAERWGTENYSADAQEILDFAEIRFSILDEAIEKIALDVDDSVLFLERTQYEGKGNTIEWNEE